MDGDPRTGLLERGRELAAINRLCRASRDGAGEALLLEGPAGIGKSSLLAAARTEGEAAGLRVLTARASELESGFGFGVVRQLFEPVLAGAAPPGRAAGRRGAPPPPPPAPARGAPPRGGGGAPPAARPPRPPPPPPRPAPRPAPRRPRAP